MAGTAGEVMGVKLMPAYVPWMLIVGGLLMWGQLYRTGGTLFEHLVAAVAALVGGGLLYVKPSVSS
jgi:hypothetical protein